MTGRQFEKLFRRHLLPELPGFGCKGSLLFATPIQGLLRGFSFDTSAYDRRRFDIEVFVQPLYIPVDFIFYTFGERLPYPSDGWCLSEGEEASVMAQVLASIKGRGLQFIGYIQTPRDLAHKRALVNSSPNDPHVVRAVAYSHALAHEYPEAVQALDRLDAIMSEDNPLRQPWDDELQEQGRLMRKLLLQSPEEAVDLLERWTEQTRAALRLPPAGA